VTPAADRFIADVLQNRCNAAILDRLPQLELPDCWLVAGCLFQTIWNQRQGASPEASIKDYDIFYFDGANLSASGEAAVNARAKALFADLNITVEMANQARVHLWYPDYFHHPYPPLQSARDGIGRFLVECTCVGLQPQIGGPLLYAPNGLDDLYAGMLKPNPLCNYPALFDVKAASYRSRWPWLNIKPRVKPD
jgi:uncharacterized protein